MPDPWTIIGTTSAILTFVEAASELYAVVKDFYVSGTTKRLDRLKFEIQRLERSLKSELNRADPLGYRRTPEAERLRNDMNDVRVRIEKITQKFSELHKDLKVPGYDAKTSFEAMQVRVRAIRTGVIFTLKKSAIESLEQEWEDCERDFMRCVYDLFRPELHLRFDYIQEKVLMFKESPKKIDEIQKTLDDLDKTHRTEYEALVSIVQAQNLIDSVFREHRNRVWILDALHFPSMDARREEIETAEDNTFQWWIDSNDLITYADSTYKITFKDWLAADQTNSMFLPSPYHIVGKPGSGKSTLMKLVDKAIQPNFIPLQESRRRLEQWACGTQLITASFYAWKAGERFQRSFEGLIRTLLHSILLQAAELVPVAFPNRWKPDDFTSGKGMDQRSAKIPFEEIFDAFKRVAGPQSDTSRISDNSFFFIIDGLDELDDYRGCPGGSTSYSVSKLICSWVQHNGIKVCVSSREENPFLNTFAAEQRLCLHMVTRQDVAILTETRLMPRLCENFPLSDSTHFRELIDLIVNKSEGVFLWVTMVITELLHKMDDRQSLDAIHRAIDESSSKSLEEFFSQILERIRHSDREEAYSTFAVAVALTEHYRGTPRVDVRFTLFHHSFIKECLMLGTRTSSEEFSAITAGKAVERCNDFASRLPSLCRGLLDTTRRSDYPINDTGGWPAVHALDTTRRIEYPINDTGGWPAVHVLDRTRCEVPERLVFMHRSLFDFVRESENSPIRKAPPPGPLIIKSFGAVLQSLNPDSTDPYVQSMRRTSIYSVFCFLETEFAKGQDERHKLTTEILALEQILLHQQPYSILPRGTSLPDLNLDDLRVVTTPELYSSLVETAFLQNRWEYLKWALRNYPQWIHSAEFISWILRQALRWNRLGSKTVSLHIPRMVELGWLPPNAPLRDDSILSAVGFNPPLRGSPWLLFVIYLWLRTELGGPYEWLRHYLIPFLRLGADPRIEFTWFWYSPPSKAFGLRVKMGEIREAQRIQGPEWGGDYDQILIHSCMNKFQRHSKVLGRSKNSRRGRFTLRDLIDTLWKSGFEERDIQLINNLVAQ